MKLFFEVAKNVVIVSKILLEKFNTSVLMPEKWKKSTKNCSNMGEKFRSKGSFSINGEKREAAEATFKLQTRPRHLLSLLLAFALHNTNSYDVLSVFIQLLNKKQ